MVGQKSRHVHSALCRMIADSTCTVCDCLDWNLVSLDEDFVIEDGTRGADSGVEEHAAH